MSGRDDPDRTRGQAARALAELLRRRQGEILERWRSRVRDLPGARGLPDPLLFDEVSELLDELALHLEEVAGREGDAGRERREAKAAAAHGVERLRAGFELGEVVAEYALLRMLVFEVASSEIQLPLSLIRFVNDAIDRSIGTAVKTYARQQALEERKRRSEHIAFVTHEMRTPLSTVSAVTDILQEGEGAPEPRVAAMLKQSVTRLDGLIRGLIEESRQIGGDLMRDSRPGLMKLHPLVEAIVADLRATADRAGMALHNGVPEAMSVWADPNILDIVLANLMKNAIDHSGGRGVFVGARADDDEVVCWVEDDGRGIPPERLQVIFEPYETRDSRGLGTGLGLHIAKRFVQALEGDIVARSGRDGGARIELRLPKRARERKEHPD